MNRFAAIAIVSLLMSSPAFAHAIRMKVEVTATEVRAEVRYDKAKEDGGPVTVTLQRIEPKEEIAKEKLGVDGSSTFPRPQPGVYRMIAQDDFGHRVEVDFEVLPGNEISSHGSKTLANSEWLTLAGLGIIGVLVLGGWWFAGRKK
jgi:hypothetical protein